MGKTRRRLTEFCTGKNSARFWHTSTGDVHQPSVKVYLLVRAGILYWRF